MERNRYTAPAGEEDTRLENLSKGWPRQISHSLHKQHHLVKALRPPHNCDSCHTPGKEWSFYCAACDFDLHPDCAVEAQLAESAKPWPRTVDHRLHRLHPLVKTRLDSFWCDSCGESGTWWCFYCEQCDFGLHLHCAVGPRSTAVEQPQTTALELTRVEKESYWCSRCAEEGKGPCYSLEDLRVDLHSRCAAAASAKGGGWPRSLTNELHRQHELVRAIKNGYICDKCWTEGNGWSFGCDDCDFHLHPKCAVEVRAPGGDSGWVDDMMHEQQKQKVLQRIQELQQQQGAVPQEAAEVEDDKSEQDDGGEEDLVIRFTTGRAAGDGLLLEQQMRLLQEAALQKLQLETTMNQLEQISLLGGAIQSGAMQPGSGVGGGVPARRQDPPYYRPPYPNNRFGYY